MGRHDNYAEVCFPPDQVTGLNVQKPEMTVITRLSYRQTESLLPVLLEMIPKVLWSIKLCLLKNVETEFLRLFKQGQAAFQRSISIHVLHATVNTFSSLRSPSSSVYYLHGSEVH